MGWSDFSFFFTLHIKSLKIFARFNWLQSKADWNTKTDGNFFVLGVEFSPAKGIKIAPNYRNFSQRPMAFRKIIICILTAKSIFKPFGRNYT